MIQHTHGEREVLCTCLLLSDTNPSTLDIETSSVTVIMVTYDLLLAALISKKRLHMNNLATDG